MDDTTASLLKPALVAAQVEQWKMPPHNFLRVGAAMITGKLSINYMVDLVTKYIGGWGEEQITYRFEGYKDGECVATVVRTAVESLHLEINADSNVLKQGDTYDATRIEIVVKDQNGNRVPFVDSSVKVTVDGPATIIGPTEFPLIGGDRAFWIRTTDKKGKIKITINASGIEEKTIELISE